MWNVDICGFIVEYFTDYIFIKNTGWENLIYVSIDVIVSQKIYNTLALCSNNGILGKLIYFKTSTA